MFVTRSLKEAWILGQIKPLHDDGEEKQQPEKDSLIDGQGSGDVQQQQKTTVNSKAEKLLDAILQES